MLQKSSNFNFKKLILGRLRLCDGGLPSPFTSTCLKASPTLLRPPHLLWHMIENISFPFWCIPQGPLVVALLKKKFTTPSQACTLTLQKYYTIINWGAFSLPCVEELILLPKTRKSVGWEVADFKHKTFQKN